MENQELVDSPGGVTSSPGPTAHRALDLLKGELTAQTVNEFRKTVFSTTQGLESLRDWLSSPMAEGAPRALALWSLGRHKDAIPLLEQFKDNPAVAACLSKSYAAIGRFDDAEKILANVEQDPVQAETYLAVFDAKNDAEGLEKALARVQSVVDPIDAKYYAGRLKELQRDPEGAIALYDEVLGTADTHRKALFRLALNVDLRGEDEEARDLYERALMAPPVNVSCVMNLGILYEDMGNYRRAMQCFDFALQADPDNKRARLFRRDAAAALNMYYDEDQERREDKRNRILRTPINDFELSVRSRNCLVKMNVRTLGDLVKKTEAELLSYKNFGETSLQEIKEILSQKGLRLGMGTEELMSRDLSEAPEAPTIPLEEMPDPNSPDPTKRPVTELDLSVRSRRIVDLLKIRSIGDLSGKTEAELLACPNFGQTSLNEIKSKLDELGLSLRG